MTTKYVTTKKPELRGELMRTADPQWLDILKQINERLGVGGTIPTKAGGLVGFRVDLDNMTLEAFKGGKWQTAAVAAGQQAADSGFAILSPNGLMIDKPLVLTDSLTLRALTASRLVSTGADKALASVGDLTAWIGQGSANRVTVANDGDGTVTLSLPQDIDTAADVQFGTVTTTGQISAGASGEATLLAGNLAINAGVLYKSGLGGVEFLSDGKVRVNISTGSAPAFQIGTALTGMLRADSGVVSVDSGTGYEVPLTFTDGVVRVADSISLDTTYSPTFAGLTANGPININYSHTYFTTVTKPTACTAALIALAGNVNAGTHKYVVTYVTAYGETEIGTVSNTVTTDASNGQVSLTGIPVSAVSLVTARKIYRTQAGGTTYLLLTTINDNATTIYTDNTADGSLTGTDATYKENTTAGKVLIDNTVAMFIGKTRNTSLGFGALDSITTADSNVAIGLSALTALTSGYNNTSVGQSSAQALTTGISNEAFGFTALYSMTTGGYNVAIGEKSLKFNVDGSYNTAVGNQAMGNAAANTGSYNTCIGRNAGLKITGGSNAILGESAGSTITTGGYNVSIGGDSGKRTTTGSFNTFIGGQVGSNASVPVNTNYAIGLGYNAQPTASNMLAIGGGVNAAGAGGISVIAINGLTDTDITVNFYGTTNSGLFAWMEDEDYFQFSDDINLAAGEVLKVGGTQVVGARVIDARIDDAINSGDATTDGVIDAMRDAMITHGLIAAA